MQINSDYNNNLYNTTKQTSFEGLTKVMSKRIYVNPDYVNKLSRMYTNAQGSVGSLPHDMFQLFRTESKDVNALKIRQVKEALNEANEILAGIEELKIENGRAMKPNNLVNAFLPRLAKINIQPERIPRIITEMRKRLTPDNTVLAEFSDKAGRHLEKRFREIGLLGNSDRVQLTYIDQGKYKNAFKLQLLDKDNKDIIHPKTLLSFKSEKSAMGQINVLLGLIKNYYKSTKPQDYLNIIGNILDHASAKVVPPDKKEIYRNSLLDIYSKMKTQNEEDKFLELIKKTMRSEIKYNGVGPESNITQFIKRSAGHPMKSSNYIDVFYLNMLHNVGLSELSDSALPKATKKINLHKYGLFHDDLITNKNNVVGERVIDYGGIKPLRGMEQLSNNSVARRYYHKISQVGCKNEHKTNLMRVKYWNELYTKAENAQIPQHNDIRVALDKGRTLIAPEYWHLLADAEAAL